MRRPLLAAALAVLLVGGCSRAGDEARVADTTSTTERTTTSSTSTTSSCPDVAYDIFDVLDALDRGCPEPRPSPEYQAELDAAQAALEQSTTIPSIVIVEPPAYDAPSTTACDLECSREILCGPLGCDYYEEQERQQQLDELNRRLDELEDELGCDPWSCGP